MHTIVKIIFPFVLAISLLSGCTQNKNEEVQLIDNEELLSILITNDILDVSNEIEVDGKLESERLLVNYFTVSPEEYFEAFKNSSESIDFFNRDFRINEKLKPGAERKNDSLLIIKTYYKDLIFKDYKERSKFFYEGKVDQLHIVKGYQFEDSFTYFIDASTGDIVSKLWGTLTENYSKEDLFLYSDGIVFDFDQLTEVSFFEPHLFGLDTLLVDQTQWIAKNAFFTGENEIYYVHTAYGDGSFKSTYAKMEIIRK